MPLSLAQLKNQVIESDRRLVWEFPEVRRFLPSPAGLASLHQELTLGVEKTSLSGVRASLNQEERQAIFTKLRALSQSDHELSDEEWLYLEQQLADLYNLPVVRELATRQLPMLRVQLATRPHLVRFPSDQLERHSKVHQAGLRATRSFFGWLGNTTALAPEVSLVERYGLSLPLFLLPDWPQAAREILAWYRHRPLLLINAERERAVIGVVDDLAPLHQLRTQVAISPELMEEGQFYYPGASGQALCFFLDASLSTLILGEVASEASHPPLLAVLTFRSLLRELADPALRDSLLSRVSGEERPAIELWLDHWLASRVLSALLTFFSAKQKSQFWLLSYRPDLNPTLLLAWLDKQSRECRLIINETCQKTLYLLKAQLESS